MYTPIDKTGQKYVIVDKWLVQLMKGEEKCVDLNKMNTNILYEIWNC